MDFGFHFIQSFVNVDKLVIFGSFPLAIFTVVLYVSDSGTFMRFGFMFVLLAHNVDCKIKLFWTEKLN